MTGQELRQKFQAFLDTYQNQRREELALGTATLIRELVRQRVQSSGQNFEGRPFVAYTPSYARQRDKAGAQTNQVDYTRSGRLWANIVPEIEGMDADSITVGIGPRTEENRVKILGPGTLTPRKDGQLRGLPQRPSAEEVRQGFEAWAGGIIEDFLRITQN